MKIENNKIIEATEAELYERYLETEMDDIYSFDDYIGVLEQTGVTVTDKLVGN